MYRTHVDTPILVTGATGTVGRPLVRALVAAGASVRAASRSAHPVDGAEAVRVDLAEPASWAGALAGVRTLFLLLPPRASAVPFLEAARASGARHVVLLSVQGADHPVAARVVPHARVEAWLRTSGMTWTFVRPSFFVQNLSVVHGRQVREHDELLLPAGRGLTAFVDVDDVAAVAAAALLDPAGHAGRAWTPTGPEALTYDEVAARMGAVLGRPIAYRRPGLVAHAVRPLRWGMAPGMVAVTSVVYTTARLGLAAGLTGDVEVVTGLRPARVEDVLRRERAAFERPAADRPAA